ncbi:unnamed protein product [Schistocephalus solidus]|uniref:Uncharacterized protein n=1 Tax=Schistocephalus solidus TaxID=70667 RepID=A0A183SP01_SCHSO|nr:unnamed protein product [Schistocephalus solidus]
MNNLGIGREIAIAPNIRVYRTSVWPPLLYDHECWTAPVKDERKLEVFVHCYLKLKSFQMGLALVVTASRQYPRPSKKVS